MSEIKRAQLIPIGSQKESDKSSKEPRKTVRIVVVLPESTEDTCPEYNYKDELAVAKKFGKCKEEGGSTLNGLNRLDEFGDDDDDVKRIARQMEEKYGTGTSLSKKKRKGRKDDYADIGMGYDESDSFIDNTDGYDEMIPQNVTTLHGGFYINSGALEFKTDDEADSDFSSSSSDDENSKEMRKPTSRKRIIESSDETDRENKTESVDGANRAEKKRKLQNGGNGVQQSLKKKLLGQNNKIYIKKRRLQLDPQKKTVKELLREKREDLNMSIPECLDATVEGDQKEKKNASISSNVTDVIESVVKASSEDKTVENSTTTKVVVTSSSDGESSHDNSTRTTKVEVKLPENLPADILSVITAVKNAAEHSSLDEKNSFPSEINLLILRLERKCKCLGKPSKMKVYEHLSAVFRCKTEALIQRAKSLVFDDEHKKLKSLISGLQSEINKIMPSLLENYEKESQRILQKKFSQESLEKEENKGLRMPKRRFQWNDVTKKQLKDILVMKKRCLLLEGKSKDHCDTLMTAFLKTEIQVLWPEGWMSMNALNKICTLYADVKRILNNSSSSNPAPSVSSQPKSETSTAPTTTPTVKNLPQSFNNSNLSITPIVAPPKTETKVHSVTNEVTVSKTNDSSINLSMKSLPETSQPCDIKPASPKREIETKLKVKPPSELLKPPVSNHVNKKESTISLISDDSVIILDSAARFSPSKDKSHAKSDDSNYCQVIDLSDKHDFKVKAEKTEYKVKPEPKPHPKKDKTITEQISKHHELSITPTYPKVVEQPKSKPNEDIQMVLENLKVLQKMSSPKKSIEAVPKKSVEAAPKKSVEIAPASTAVPVIAFNKSYAPKPHSESSTMQRYDYNKSEPPPAPSFSTSFQNEFQKQLFGVFNQYTANSSKNYNSTDRYPHISSSASNVAAGDKYLQNSNNNYTQSSNGHKSSTPAQQSGTYSILDDMFANLLTQYGYSKEATAPNLNRNS